ncbi:MAG: DegT/DnrJ/EryC1/StrS family aminotransferase [Betaproteobacteria bacterium]
MSARPIRPRDRFLVFGAPVIEEAEIAEVVATLRSGWIGTGPRTARFEEDFKAYKGAAHAVAVSSCTAALHLGMLAAGVRPGDEVITSALTFCATVNPIIHAGATPVLVDVDASSMNMTAEAVEQAITEHTRAIVPVHFAGRPCAMDALCALAERHDLTLIEDCAHAIEAEFGGRATGTFGAFGCFSFYATKNVTTGEGGMLVARREEDADAVRRLALHGMSQDAWKRFNDEGYRHYDVMEAGFKCNMTDLQAAIGIHQLKRVEANWRRREAIWRRYDDALRDLPLTLPAPPAPGTRHALHLYTVLVDEAQARLSRDDFLDAMTARRIGVGVHYVGLPEHAYYRKRYGWRPEDFPNAMRIGRSTVSLPLSAGLTDDDVADVVSAVRGILS